MKAVIDTNVYVSMLLSPRGSGAWLIALWNERRFEVVVSPELFVELVEVLNRPEIGSRVDQQRKLALFRRIRHDALWSTGAVEAGELLADPTDDFLMAAALELNAEFIVTWDTALLAQNSCKEVQIITPDQFISMIVRKK